MNVLPTLDVFKHLQTCRFQQLILYLPIVVHIYFRNHWHCPSSGTVRKLYFINVIEINKVSFDDPTMYYPVGDLSFDIEQVEFRMDLTSYVKK